MWLSRPGLESRGRSREGLPRENPRTLEGGHPHYVLIIMPRWIFGKYKAFQGRMSGRPHLRCRMCGGSVERLDACPLMDQRGICLECHEAIHPGKPDSSP